VHTVELNLTCLPEAPYTLPSFTGTSYLELATLDMYAKLKIDIELRSEQGAV
jgi:hypothetical protein